MIKVYLNNNGGFQKDIIVTDNVCRNEAWKGTVPAWEKEEINICKADSGYGNFSIYNRDSQQTTDYSLVSDGETKSIY